MSNIGCSGNDFLFNDAFLRDGFIPHISSLNCCNEKEKCSYLDHVFLQIFCFKFDLENLKICLL